MRKVDNGEEKEKRKEKEKKEKKRKKRMAFLVATTSLPAVYRPNGYARTTTAGTPHACAKTFPFLPLIFSVITFPHRTTAQI